MLKKIKSLIAENRKFHEENIKRLSEIEWAHVFHDSIRSDDWINKTSLSIGRWAGGYAFFYVLVKILKETNPKSILEFGLGESSKVIYKYVSEIESNAKHLIIEHDENWKKKFLNSFKTPNFSEIVICPLEERNIQGHKNLVYRNFENFTKDKFDLIVIDGPFGSKSYSRFEVVSILKKIDENEDFIILFDDTNRLGEIQTLNYIENLLESKGIKYHSATYKGTKDCTIICSEQFKFLKTL